MASATKSRFLSRAVPVAALSLALLGGLSSTAFAAADPSVSADPSTGLSDGATINVTVSDYAAEEQVAVTECASLPDGLVVCDGKNIVGLITDTAGTGVTPYTVHKAFQGYTRDGQPWGPVDCATVQCGIGASNTGAVLSATKIYFQ
ncbi:enediyne antibiotic chromoprotein [Amycolatopsis sp. NPDC051071]|uniref:enediyne antibiotic chromoprotein n=1 Tax=Amycolatopsis sp. NPDC051071 TaxID=3154637 RepID=UPI00343E7577